MSTKITSDYLKVVYNPVSLAATINKMAFEISKLHKKFGFEAIAFSGFSGSSVAFGVSARTNIPLLAIRKDTDDGHHKMGYGVLEGAVDAGSYIILDDFIGTGATMKRIIARIEEHSPAARCVGIILWNSIRDMNLFIPDKDGNSFPHYRTGIPVHHFRDAK